MSIVPQSTNPRRLPQPDKSLWDASQATKILTVAQGAQLVRFSVPRFRRWLSDKDGPRTLTSPMGAPVTTREWIAFAWRKLNKAIGEEAERDRQKRIECEREAAKVGYSSPVSGVHWCHNAGAWRIQFRWGKHMRSLGMRVTLASAESDAKLLIRIRDSGVSWRRFRDGDYDEPRDIRRHNPTIPMADNKTIDPSLPTHSDCHTTTVASQRERLIQRRQSALKDHST